MLLKLSMVIRGLQLLLRKNCKVDSASAFDPNAGMKATIKQRTKDE